MSRLFSTILEISAAAIVLIPIYLILNRVYLKNFKKAAIYCIFSFYLAAVYVLVGMPNITYIRFDLNLNIIPFLGLVDDLKNSILNILLFVPLGFMLPILWQKYRTKKETVMFGLGMSLAIEILQIFTYRATDVNDLITNTAGAFLGVCFAELLMRKYPSIKSLVNERKTRELYIVCGILLAVMFFLHPYLSAVMWNIIYR